MARRRAAPARRAAPPRARGLRRRDARRRRHRAAGGRTRGPRADAARAVPRVGLADPHGSTRGGGEHRGGAARLRAAAASCSARISASRRARPTQELHRVLLGLRGETGDLRERLARCFLLGGLLRAALAHAELLAVDDGRAREVALVRRPLGREHGVDDLPPAAGERLLQLRLVVDVRVQRVVDAAGERVDDRGLDVRRTRARGRARRAPPRGARPSTLRFFASRSSSSTWRPSLCWTSSRPRSSSRADHRAARA